jgi:hypothetical protein
MTTSWNGYAGNFGGINHCCLPKNQFAVLAETEKEEINAVPSKKVRFNMGDQEPRRMHTPQTHKYGCQATTKTCTHERQPRNDDHDSRTPQHDEGHTQRRKQ